MTTKRLKERTKEIHKLLGPLKDRPVVDLLLQEVVGAFEAMEFKLHLVLKHKETALAIAGARRKQAARVSECVRALVKLYDDNVIDQHYAADGHNMRDAFEAARALIGDRGKRPNGRYARLPELPAEAIGAHVGGVYFTREEYDRNFR